MEFPFCGVFVRVVFMGSFRSCGFVSCFRSVFVVV